ncbi:bifunctional diaminohydroxyphosphoribosylaminopyrimidine deaminase/5-amino-6-(5-phosphoribosylamino)uracil reductase RibD [Aquiflexum sp. LQ15W]|uniref:bifunctional diaminohydroxyphosphoribosylaminopyrimidine deaminase/5-amino-6-(5-phosphoribosylamino)uracil reductase RibD n=1 Tax=Cognataquiflexum nitidum TaxID=2922272 RepID=UPI001F142F9A|nr:bifunctional diaminohydroxyphosphoribosylaminopyrimidine deaminase/5-amino-6-(5-phosphoribosylamino)uracil reductase RibD [Cognataquiflexum nitidum]MCH6199633.1 bifunctional diaminohydroxyphosphoribosylaminopyrimidine deaminase/5-amino-6-(5-phosphoribosylamino)uracil reductase RibD [Cognataquiflexum nitidum]
MTQDELYMRRAIELAEWGRGNVSPNPMVGCVVVHNGTIIGEGFHQVYGGPHAEPNAINSVANQDLLSESTVYVSLEPCAHWGKTPPCANLLVEKKVKKVVIGAMDSNPLVGGKGIQILKEAGIEVVTGILEKEVREQNKRFFTFIEKKRPFVILKWAQTRDGFVARENFDSKWISNAYSRQLVHKWRSEEDAILVGTSTAKYDNPQLNVRDWEGRNPVRIVLDRTLILDSNLHLFDGMQKTICYNEAKSESSENLEWVKLSSGFGIGEVLEDLYQRKIQSLIVEGGAQVLKSFIQNELWDEARVFTGQVQFGKGIPAPLIKGKLLSESEIMGDRLAVWRYLESEVQPVPFFQEG